MTEATSTEMMTLLRDMNDNPDKLLKLTANMSLQLVALNLTVAIGFSDLKKEMENRNEKFIHQLSAVCFRSRLQ